MIVVACNKTDFNECEYLIPKCTCKYDGYCDFQAPRDSRKEVVHIIEERHGKEE